MNGRKKILFVSGEVEPFARETEIASIARHLPQLLHDSGEFEVRIMMPRYGTISERRNRLHEVIRLCGTPVAMGKKTENLKVKVASIPGIRLQVYFMDNPHFFKRKGLHQDKEGVVFKDNTARSLFFTRAVVETLRKLRWKPDVVHAFGWISGFIPLVVGAARQDDELFQGARLIYTPDNVEANATITEDLNSKMSLQLNGEDSGLSLCELGIKYADSTVFPSSAEPHLDINGHATFSPEHAQMMDQAIALYTA